MYYGTREEKDKAARKIAQFHRETAELFPAIRKVIENFDGKVFNVRFEKALQEKTGKRIFAKAYNAYIYIYLYFEGREYNLAILHREDMADGKRINAAKMIESAREHRASHYLKAYTIEAQMTQIDAISQQLQDIERTLTALTCHLDYSIRDIYGLTCRLSRS